MAEMAAEERIALIKENLAETLDFDMIEKIINEGKDPKVYWGTYVTPGHSAPSGPIALLLRGALLRLKWPDLSLPEKYILI